MTSSGQPFAALGFASVVSMIPGVYLFRMPVGLLQITAHIQVTQDLVETILVDGANTAMITLALSFGLLVPKLIIDACDGHTGASKGWRSREGCVVTASPIYPRQRFYIFKLALFRPDASTDWTNRGSIERSRRRCPSRPNQAMLPRPDLRVPHLFSSDVCTVAMQSGLLLGGCSQCSTAISRPPPNEGT
jgi:hypothetical protein